MTKEEKFQELDQSIIDDIKKVEQNLNLPLDINYLFQDVKKQKKLIKISKIPEQYAVPLKADILVQVNSLYYYTINDESVIKILIEDELDKISFNMDKGTIKISNPSIQLSPGLCHKHTFEKVEMAKESEKTAEGKIKEQNQE